MALWAGLVFTSSASVSGQAVVLDRGQSAVGLAYQHTFVRLHQAFDGTKVDIGHIMAYSIRDDFSYGLTDRVSLDADLSFVAGKYIGTLPHGRLDDGRFHQTFQDLHVGVRTNVLMRPVVATPFVRITIPTHHYQLEGHTGVGKGRGELTLGTYAGRDLGPILPNAYVEGMLSHTWAQRTVIPVASERLNRTNGLIELGYYLSPAWTVRAFGSGLRTHGGWDLPRQFGPGEAEEHDRFDKTKDIQAGGAVSYSFRNGLSLYSGYFSTTWGRTAHLVAGPTFGMMWAPVHRQSWMSRKRVQPAMQTAEAIMPAR